MPISETKRRNNDAYNAKCDRIVIQPIKERGQAIRQAAAAAGESLQGYILQAVERRMEQDEIGRPSQRPLDYRRGDGDTMVAYDRETGEDVAESSDGINWTEISDN